MGGRNAPLSWIERERRRGKEKGKLGGVEGGVLYGLIAHECKENTN